MSLIQLTDIVKTYTIGEQSFDVLKKVSFGVEKGEFVSIMGHSGSGKSTLMNIIGMLDTPTSGGYMLDGIAVESFNETQMTEIRRKKIGFVFQQYNLLPRMDALHQVMTPLSYQGFHKRENEERSRKALERVGLAERIYNKPNELSGGQQQRVSIARAMVGEPEIILADEPTGALDSQTGVEIMELFKKLNEEGRTIIVITHEKEIADYAKRKIHIADGKIIHDT